jgi:hypothetical protein
MTSSRRSKKIARDKRALVASGEPGRANTHMPTKSVTADVALLNIITAIKRDQGMLEKELRVKVRAARRAGVSWQRIGAALGVTRQSVEERFGPYPPGVKVPPQKKIS